MRGSFTLPTGNLANVQNGVMENKAGRMEGNKRH